MEHTKLLYVHDKRMATFLKRTDIFGKQFFRNSGNVGNSLKNSRKILVVFMLNVMLQRENVAF